MITIRVRFASFLSHLTGVDEVTLSINQKNITIRELVNQLRLRYPKLSSVQPISLVNNVPSTYDSEIKDKDYVILLPPIAGG